MRTLDETKRKAIMGAAVSLFSVHPYEAVRLDDIAEQAHVGKGTLYLYFRNKEDLYGSLVLQGFTELIERLNQCIAKNPKSAWETLSKIVREFVSWVETCPELFSLMRAGEREIMLPELVERRTELVKLIEQTIVRGNQSGEFQDPRPDLTAQFIPGCVRSALRHGPSELDYSALSDQILRVIGGGIRITQGAEL